MSSLPTSSETAVAAPFNYQRTARAILQVLKRDRDRQIIARRFGFDLARRQTLEQIGQDFGITRERVRQIEKAALIKMMGSNAPELAEANRLLISYLEAQGGLMLLGELAQALEAALPEQKAYVVFLAALAPGIELIEEDEQLRAGVGILPQHSRTRVLAQAAELTDVLTALGKPTTLAKLAPKLPGQPSAEDSERVAKLAKTVANFERNWGLVSWPQVNPRSIRDKTYLVMSKHGRPLHFGDIAERIRKLDLSKRQVTVQAVHNELIKDARFVLIGRGIYALAEWGYSPGTVADIIADVLRADSPLHKDEIVRRVLTKRQVKTTTIVLNLQEKDQFVRVAKATYTLRKA